MLLEKTPTNHGQPRKRTDRSLNRSTQSSLKAQMTRVIALAHNFLVYGGFRVLEDEGIVIFAESMIATFKRTLDLHSSFSNQFHKLIVNCFSVTRNPRKMFLV